MNIPSLKIMVVIGARPNYMKTAPLIHALNAASSDELSLPRLVSGEKRRSECHDGRTVRQGDRLQQRLGRSLIKEKFNHLNKQNHVKGFIAK